MYPATKMNMVNEENGCIDGLHGLHPCRVYARGLKRRFDAVNYGGPLKQDLYSHLTSSGLASRSVGWSPSLTSTTIQADMLNKRLLHVDA